MRIQIVALAAFVLTGCVTLGSKPVPIGKDTYQLSMTGVGFATQANTNMKALREAADFCSGIGLHMVPKNSSESGVYGWSPRQDSLVFMCLRSDDPRYLNTPAMHTESH
jgi:hypothetical protein